MTIRIQGNVIIDNNRDATPRNITSTGTISLTANSTSIRQTTTSTWSGDAPNGVGKLEYHSNRWYINAGANSTEVVQFRRGGSNVANINNSGQITMAAGTTTSHAVRGDRTISAGDGLTGGGNLSANRSIAVDGTVVRTSRIISTTNGISGGGNLSADRTFSLDSSVARLHDVASFNSNGTGWRRVAQASGSNGRGHGEVILYTTGGSWTPRHIIIKAFHDWGSAGFITSVESSGFAANAVRVTGDGSNSWIEVNFTSSLSGSIYSISQGYNRYIRLTGTLPDGGGSVRNTVNITNGISTAGNFRTNSRLIMGAQATAADHAVRADRNISTTNGITGGGNLTADRTIQVDATVVRTTGNQTIGGNKTFTGTNTIPRIAIQRISNTSNGISWYSTGFRAWATYMSPAGQASTGPTGNITAPSGTLVTSWALRNYIENAGGYGWTFESGTSGQVTPSVVAEIRSSDGSARFGGTVTLGVAGTATTHAVRADRTISTGGGLSGGGNLTANRTFSVDSTVIRTTGNQSMSGTKTFTTQIRMGNASSFRQNSTGTWTGNPGSGVGKIEYHSNRWYIVSGSNSTEICRWRRDSTDRMWLDNNGNLTTQGNVTAFSSDERLKTNITKIEDAIEKLKQIDGVTFDWDRSICEKVDFHPDDVTEVGVLAQQVEEVLPEAVKPAPFDTSPEGGSKSGENYLTVQYEKLVPLLIEAIKEQQKRIESLEELVCKK